MANITTGTGTKKETVYDGPSPRATQGVAYKGPSPAPRGGTVYQGAGLKTGGTVYGGPGSTPNNESGSGGTVYRPSRPAATNVASAARHGAARGGGILFAIAGFSAINTCLILAGSTLVLGQGLTLSKASGDGAMAGLVVLNILVVGIFVMLGIFARAGSSAALVIGMLLYVGDTALLLFSGDPAQHVPGIVVHGFLLIGLFKAFSQLQD